MNDGWLIRGVRLVVSVRVVCVACVYLPSRVLVFCSCKYSESRAKHSHVCPNCPCCACAQHLAPPTSPETRPMVPLPPPESHARHDTTAAHANTQHASMAPYSPLPHETPNNYTLITRSHMKSHADSKKWQPTNTSRLTQQTCPRQASASNQVAPTTLTFQPQRTHWRHRHNQQRP